MPDPGGFVGGGVIGFGDGRSACGVRLPPVLDSGLMVDEDEDEVADSRTDARPVVRGAAFSSRAIRSIPLVETGGRLRVGLVVLGLKGAFKGVGTPGDWDDIDVGVEVRLNAPGDSDRRVEEPLSWPWVGVGGGSVDVDVDWGFLRLL